MSDNKHPKIQLEAFRRCPPSGPTLGWIECLVDDELWPNIQIFRDDDGGILVESHPQGALTPPPNAIVDEVEDYVLRFVVGRRLGR